MAVRPTQLVGRMYITSERIEAEGIAWHDSTGEVVPLHPVVRALALRFRRAGHPGVIRDAPNEYFWIHDAIHGWLGADSSRQGEQVVRHIQDNLHIRTQQDVLDLIEIYTPDEWS